MGLLRHHSDDDGQRARRYRMRQELISIGDDFWIEDDDGHRVFRVDGKALRIRDTWEMKDAHGDRVARIKERKVALRDKMAIDLGERTATITKRKLGLREHFKVEVDHAPDLKVHGNFVDHEYEIESDQGTVGSVSKRWFRARDTYGVEVSPLADPVLVLAITVAVDAMSHGR